MKDHDPIKSSKFITYLDMNNFYGWGLSEYLPYGGFKWLKNVDGFDVMSISEKSPIGFFSKLILNILINYVNCTMIIHYLQKNLLFLVIFCQNTVKKLLKKLITNLGNKTKYVLHYRNLQLYLSLRMKLTKIHRVLKFKQSD